MNKTELIDAIAAEAGLSKVDAKKAVAIAGIMGGENSKITDDVQTMIFEAATFDGTNIRLSSKRLGLRTDASGKFEKGLEREFIYRVEKEKS